MINLIIRLFWLLNNLIIKYKTLDEETDKKEINKVRYLLSKTYQFLKEWSGWNWFSKTCGSGNRKRWRIIENRKIIENQNCNTNSCRKFANP